MITRRRPKCPDLSQTLISNPTLMVAMMTSMSGRSLKTTTGVGEAGAAAEVIRIRVRIRSATTTMTTRRRVTVTPTTRTMTGPGTATATPLAAARRTTIRGRAGTTRRTATRGPSEISGGARASGMRPLRGSGAMEDMEDRGPM